MNMLHAELEGFEKLGLKEQKDITEVDLFTESFVESFIEPFDFKIYDVNKPGVLWGKGNVGLGFLLTEEKTDGEKTVAMMSDYWQKTILISEKEDKFSINFFDNSMLPQIIEDPYDVDRRIRKEAFLQMFPLDGGGPFERRNLMFQKYLRDFTLELLLLNPEKRLDLSTYDEKRASVFSSFAKKYGLEDRISVTLLK